MVSDILPDQGGDDAGMSPHEILEAALAACTSMTVQLYAQHKQWPLTSCNVEVKIISEGAETAFAVQTDFIGDLSEEQKSRLLEIAKKCPVHKILSNPIHITNIERV